MRGFQGLQLLVCGAILTCKIAEGYQAMRQQTCMSSVCVYTCVYTYMCVLHLGTLKENPSFCLPLHLTGTQDLPTVSSHDHRALWRLFQVKLMGVQPEAASKSSRLLPLLLGARINLMRTSRKLSSRQHVLNKDMLCSELHYDTKQGRERTIPFTEMQRSSQSAGFT